MPISLRAGVWTSACLTSVFPQEVGRRSAWFLGGQVDGNMEGERQAEGWALLSPDREGNSGHTRTAVVTAGGIPEARRAGPVRVLTSVWESWSELVSALLPRVLWVRSLPLSPTVP